MEVTVSDVLRTSPSKFPMFEAMRRVPGGLMLIPLALGVLVNTFAPDALGIGGFTTALFKDGALTLIALLIWLRHEVKAPKLKPAR